MGNPIRFNDPTGLFSDDFINGILDGGNVRAGSWVPGAPLVDGSGAGAVGGAADFFDGLLPGEGFGCSNPAPSPGFNALGQAMQGAAMAAIPAPLLGKAASRYPKLAGKIQNHHIVPLYLGGAKSGRTVPLDAAYHQLITNAFRGEWAYGQARPSAAKLRGILRRVYSALPLP